MTELQFKLLIEGDETAFEQLCIAALEIAKSIAKHHPAAYWLYDDLVGDGVTRAVEELRGLQQTKDTQRATENYIASCIRHAINGTPASTRTIKQPKSDTMIETVSIEAEPSLVNGMLLSGGEKMLELWETLHALADNEVETGFINMRAQGYLDHEIATRLNISESQVTRIRQRLLKRLENAKA